MFLNLRRQDAARYSFLLGLPAITLAGAKELYVLYRAHLDAYGWSVLSVGLLCGALSAFVAIWSLMRIMERFSSWPFAIYRVVLGSAILGLVYAGAFT